MQVPSGGGGSQEYAQNGYLMNGNFYFGYRHFQPLGIFLETPKILICPADTRTAATNFAALQNANISYFVGVDADYSKPMSLLAGDGNLSSPQTLLRAAAGGAPPLLHMTVGEQHVALEAMLRGRPRETAARRAAQQGLRRD